MTLFPILRFEKLGESAGLEEPAGGTEDFQDVVLAMAGTDLTAFRSIEILPSSDTASTRSGHFTADRPALTAFL